jgi:hypothetical protein
MRAPTHLERSRRSAKRSNAATVPGEAKIHGSVVRPCCAQEWHSAAAGSVMGRLPSIATLLKFEPRRGEAGRRVVEAYERLSLRKGGRDT